MNRPQLPVDARKVTTTFDANLNVSVEEGTLPRVIPWCRQPAARR